MSEPLRSEVDDTKQARILWRDAYDRQDWAAGERAIAAYEDRIAKVETAFLTLTEFYGETKNGKRTTEQSVETVALATVRLAEKVIDAFQSKGASNV